MLKVRALLELYKIRKTPFITGYRPIFDFNLENRIDGQITLLDRKEFSPGDIAEVEILFIKEKFSESLIVGNNFTFAEAIQPLGKGAILEILRD